MLVRPKAAGTTYWFNGIRLAHPEFTTVEGKDLEYLREVDKSGAFAFTFEEPAVNNSDDSEGKEDTKEDQEDNVEILTEDEEAALEEKRSKPLSRMTKDEVIAELDEQGIAFDPEARVADLKKLLGE